MAMAQIYEYKIVEYDAKNRPSDETIPTGVLKLLNANGANGWELFKYENDGDLVRLWMKHWYLTVE
jgi:hypothetical protein